jgi:hypothetical protein
MEGDPPSIIFIGRGAPSHWPALLVLFLALKRCQFAVGLQALFAVSSNN